MGFSVNATGWNPVLGGQVDVLVSHIGPGDVPAELSGQLQGILDRFGAGDVGAHLAAMPPKTASRLALDIFELSCAVSQGLYH